jgi:hypothetical protein
MPEGLLASDTSVHRIATRLNITGDGFLHSHRHENLKSYIVFLYGELLIDTYDD